MRRTATKALTLIMLGFAGPVILAQGTAAGTVITNTATVTFELDGVARPSVGSASVVTRVDERLEASTVSMSAGALLVTSAQDAATVSFEVTNLGNGHERLQLVVDLNVDEGGFDPELDGIFLETNGVPGLQLGAAGDDRYAPGGDDPLLEPGQSAEVHVRLALPADALVGDGAVRLTAIPASVIEATGADHLRHPEFPSPGRVLPGSGDEGVGAVVGLAFQGDEPLASAEALLRVDGPLVQLRKTALEVDDGTGGGRVISGARVVYELAVSVVGRGEVSELVVRDVLPDDLAYVDGSLTLDGVPLDDDFSPPSQDLGGYDPDSATISVGLGRVAAGSPQRRVTFAATVR